MLYDSLCVLKPAPLFFVCFDCCKVSEQRVGDGELIFFKGTKTQASCTIVLRGANDFMLDEMDRYDPWYSG